MTACSEAEFAKLFREHGPTKTAQILGVSERSVFYRRNRLEKKSEALVGPSSHVMDYPGMVHLEIKNGEVLVGSDFHIWPGAPSTCLRAFKKFVEDVKPAAVILNGDVMDFPRISRHPKDWESAPDPQEEIEAAQDHLDDIVRRCKRGARKIWTIGNHDKRFEAMIANQAPAYRGVKGVHLADHFPLWEKAMSCMINADIRGGEAIVKHIPPKGGSHSSYNSTVNAGISTIGGHLHNQNVRPFSDYSRFDRYGVDCGMVADKEHRAFAYTQNNPLNWRSGFGLLTWRQGRLLYPELVTRFDSNSVQFRGQIIKV